MAGRVILLVMDSVGIGALPDAGEYGDEGSNTLANISARAGGLRIPNLAGLGIGNIACIPYIQPEDKPLGCYGKMAEMSKGKDTITGHWEISGIILEKAFPTFPSGFPAEFITEFEQRIGRKVLGNEVASGTEIIQRLGPEHVQSGYPIVYTSADSVFQIAAHEKIISLEELMRICGIAREMLTGDLRVSRVIARPFVGQAENYQRTYNRHDFSVQPPEDTMLDRIAADGLPVIGVGKIGDIFSGRGLTETRRTRGNPDGMEMTLAAMTEIDRGLIFTNLVDFDMVYGHRNNAQGYAQALEELDAFLPRIITALRTEDILILTADHGCDPTTASTDHSREYVPLLVYGPGIKRGVNLGLRKTFADVGATILEFLNLNPPANGTSFYSVIREAGKS